MDAGMEHARVQDFALVTLVGRVLSAMNVPKDLADPTATTVCSYFTRIMLLYLILCLYSVICNQDCQNGYCSGPDQCTCDPGFAQLGGVMSPCSATICTPACQNFGTCAAFGKSTACMCLPMWTGPDCSVPTCTANCDLHGTCSLSGVCECRVGWQGDNCDQRKHLISILKN